MGFFSKKDKKQDIPKIDLATLRSAQASEGTANNAPAGISKAQLDAEIDALQNHLHQALAGTPTVKKDWNDKPRLVSGPTVKCEWADDSGERLVVRGISGKVKPQDLMAAIRMAIGNSVLSFEQTLDSTTYRIDREGIAATAERLGLAITRRLPDGSQLIEYPLFIKENNGKLTIKHTEAAAVTLPIIERLIPSFEAEFNKKVVKVESTGKGEFTITFQVAYTARVRGQAVSKIKGDIGFIINKSRQLYENTGELWIFEGENVDPECVFEDPLDRFTFTPMNRVPHKLTVGTTGSGKTSLIRFQIYILVMSIPPEALQIWISDGKDGGDFNKVVDAISPYELAGPRNVAKPFSMTAQQTNALRAELDDRKKLFNNHSNTEGVEIKNILDFNKHMRKTGRKIKPFIILLIDEFSIYNPEIKEGITATGSPGNNLNLVGIQGRSYGTFLWIASQRGQDIHIAKNLRTQLGSPNICRIEGSDGEHLECPQASDIPEGGGLHYVKVNGKWQLHASPYMDLDSWEDFAPRDEEGRKLYEKKIELDVDYAYLPNGFDDIDNEKDSDNVFEYVRSSVMRKVGYTPYTMSLGDTGTMSGSFVRGSIDGVGVGLLDPKLFDPNFSGRRLSMEARSFDRVVLYYPHANLKGENVDKFRISHGIPENCVLMSDVVVREAARIVVENPSIENDSSLARTLAGEAFLDVLSKEVKSFPRTETARAVHAIVNEVGFDFTSSEAIMEASVNAPNTKAKGDVLEVSVKKTVELLFPNAVVQVTGGGSDGGCDVRVDFKDSDESWGISCKNHVAGGDIVAKHIQAVGSLSDDERFDGRTLKKFLFHVNAHVPEVTLKQARSKRVAIMEWDEAVSWLRAEAIRRAAEVTQVSVDKEEDEQLSLDDWMKL